MPRCCWVNASWSSTYQILPCFRSQGNNVGPAKDLSLVPMVCQVGAVRPAGGLATLIHPRILAPCGKPLSVMDHEHVFGVVARLLGNVVLTIVNVHLPPSLQPAARTACCKDAASFFNGQPLGLQVLCGDFNASLEPHAGGWFKHALSPAGIWAGFRCPYPRGIATNVVHRRGRPSARLGASRTNNPLHIMYPDYPAGLMYTSCCGR